MMEPCACAMTTKSRPSKGSCEGFHVHAYFTYYYVDRYSLYSKIIIVRIIIIVQKSNRVVVLMKIISEWTEYSLANCSPYSCLLIGRIVASYDKSHLNKCENREPEIEPQYFGYLFLKMIRQLH